MEFGGAASMEVIDGACGAVIASTDGLLDSPIVAFDLDHTLIRTKSGRRFPKDLDDWEWMDGVKSKLNEVGSRHPVVIFTNQSSLKCGEDILRFYKGKVANILAELDVPVSAMIAGGYSIYRKPKRGMWDLYCEKIGMDPRTTTCLYVGDAAGRPHDFADTDYAFARNIDAAFQTPEKYFYGDDTSGGKPTLTINPSDWMKAAHAKKRPRFRPGFLRHMVLMQGPPGSGKSTWVRKHIPLDWAVVSRDVLHTKPKCFKAVRAALEAGKSVVVDNTFPSIEARAEYVEIAREYGVPVDCVVMDVTREQAEHLNAMRSEHPTHAKPRVPPIGERMFYSKQVTPTQAEGFANVYLYGFEYDPEITPPDLFAARHV